MTPVELALVGLGKWGRNYIKAVEDSGEAKVVQVVRRGDMLHNVDAVIYAGHPSGAAEACEAVLWCNKPILVEKPAGLSIGAAEAICRAEEKSLAFVLVGHQHFFSDGFEELVRVRNLCDHVQVDTIFDGPVDRDYPPLWDYGPHAVASAIALAGHPVSGLTVTPVRGLARGAAMFSWEGAHGNATCHVRFNGERRAIVRANGFEYDGYAPAEPPLTRQVRAFARAVRAKGSEDWRFGARWAFLVAKVLEEAGAETPTHPVSAR